MKRLSAQNFIYAALVTAVYQKLQTRRGRSIGHKRLSATLERLFWRGALRRFSTLLREVARNEEGDVIEDGIGGQRILFLQKPHQFSVVRLDRRSIRIDLRLRREGRSGVLDASHLWQLFELQRSVLVKPVHVRSLQQLLQHLAVALFGSVLDDVA